MQYRTLGRTDIRVSRVCLGTMTFGEQTDPADAHRQLDLALDHGVNFIDTAEAYPVPPDARTAGRTETIIGDWLAARGGRERVVLATKAAGRSNDLTWLREPPIQLDRRNITAALEGSLRRLRTDHLDLYIVHWPDRPTNFFGQLGYQHRPEASSVPIAETLGVLDELVRAGKVRAIAVSNETPWGVMTWLAAAQQAGAARIVAVQNPYNLLNRTFEIGLAEVAMCEQVGLMAYSPLAMGMLTGKYTGGARPDGARLTRFERFQRYSGERGRDAAADYVALAREHGLEPAQMALAFVHRQPFVTATIVGASRVDQLQAALDGEALELSPEVLAGIEAIHAANPNPSP